MKIGTLLPNIVLYNDPIPHPSTETTSKVISTDLSRKPDLMIVFGTSLKVHGIKKLVKNFAKTIHANKGTVIFVNKDELGKSEWGNVFDYWVQGDCDAWIHDLKYASIRRGSNFSFQTCAYGGRQGESSSIYAEESGQSGRISNDCCVTVTIVTF